MLLLADETKQTDGEWFDFKIRGQKIRLRIRPSFTSKIKELREKHKTVRNQRDRSGQMQKITEYNEEGVTDNMVDYILAGFEGIGQTGSDKPLENTIENKKRVMEIPTPEGDQGVADFVYETSRAMVIASEDDKRRKGKN